MSQKAPFSFHCCICYERLNLTDRPPVVLPCGHTYICQQCSQRLTRCMECRTRIAPVVAAAVIGASSSSGGASSSAAANNGHLHTPSASVYPRESYRAKQQRLYRQQQQQKYNMPAPTPKLQAEEFGLAAAHNASKKEPPPLVLPKNVVLMSLMEAAQQKSSQQQLLLLQQEEEGYESGDDDAQVLEGLRTLGSSCGTYVIKSKEGVWVYDGKPPPMTASASMSSVATSTTSQTTSTSTSIGAIKRSNSASSADPPGKSPTNENDPPADALQRSASNKSSKQPQPQQSNLRRRSATGSSQPQKSAQESSLDNNSSNNNSSNNNNNSSNNNSSNNNSKQVHPHGKLKNKLFGAKPIEKLEYGATVQVVCLIEDGTVAQLARGQGYIRVMNASSAGGAAASAAAAAAAPSNSSEEVLVKVGEATDEACRMEGIIHSIIDEKKQFKQQISELTKLEKRTHLNLRKFYKREVLEREERERKQREQQLLKLERSSGSNASKQMNTSVVLDLLEEDVEFDGDAFQLTPPSSPPHLLEMSMSSATSPETPASPREMRRDSRQSQQYHMADSSDHTRDSGIRTSAASQSKHVRTNSALDTDDDSLTKDKKDATYCTGLTWEEEMFNNGCDLFFCATMPLCTGRAAAASVASPHINPTSSILTGTALFPDLYRNDSIGSNRSQGDGSTVGSSVDFRTGLSGHMGCGRQQRRQTTPFKKQVRMMSEHDGAAHVRRKKGSNSSVITTEASVATL